MESSNSYITLNNGTKMPICGLGVFKLTDKKALTNIITEVGYRHIDTAAIYGNEEIVGEAIAEALSSGVKREELYITTKLWRDMKEDPVAACKESLAKLKLDYVDMYLIHWSPPDFEADGKTFKKTPMHKVWEGMEKCVEEGLTKSIGISNFNVQMMVDMLAYANIPPACNQVELHPYYKQLDFQRFCKLYGIAVVAYSPLSALGRPIGGDAKMITEEPILKELAEKYGKSVTQIALAWNLQSGNVVIPKTEKVSRAKENFEASSIVLTEEEITKINNIDVEDKVYDPINWESWNNIPIFK